MECRDVRDMADSFLAGELLTETNHEILRHLDTCPACRADLDERRALRDGVKQAFHRAPDLGASPEFAARLRSTLQNAAQPAPARRSTTLPKWWALAATVVLAAGLGLVYRGRGGTTAALARVAVGDHQNCALQFRLAEKPVPIEEAAQRYGGAYRVLEKLPPGDVVTAAGPAHVIDRHACVYGGRRFAHVVFTYRDQRVSLLVTAAGDAGLPPSIPGEALPHLTSSGPIDGMSVVSFRASRQMVLFTGAVAHSDLAKLADAMSKPLARGLAASDQVVARRPSGTSWGAKPERRTPSSVRALAVATSAYED